MEEVTSLEVVDLIKVAEKVIHLWAVESCCAIFATVLLPLVSFPKHWATSFWNGQEDRK